MMCPECTAGELLMREHQGIELSRCSRCGGVWICQKMLMKFDQSGLFWKPDQGQQLPSENTMSIEPAPCKDAIVDGGPECTQLGNENDASDLQKRVQGLLQSRVRVRSFLIEISDMGVVLRGSCDSFHAKQMAQEIVSQNTSLRIASNKIEVSDGQPSDGESPSTSS